MIRMTMNHVRQTIAAYRDVLLNGSGLTRRNRLRFVGRVIGSDNATTRSTDINFPQFTTVVTENGDAYTASAWESVVASGAGTQEITMPSDAADGTQVLVVVPLVMAGTVNVLGNYGDTINSMGAGESCTLLYLKRMIDAEDNIVGQWRVLYAYSP